MDRKLKLRQSEPQKAFCDIAGRKRISLYAGGLQGGKSVAGADALAHLLYTHKIQLPQEFNELTPEIWVLAPSFNLVKVARGYIKWRLDKAIYRDEECKKLHLKRMDAHTLWLNPMDRTDHKPIRMVFRTSSDPNDLRGAGNLLAVWWDEAAYGKEESWMVIQGRMIASRGHLLLTTTPRGKNWLYHDVYLPGIAAAGSPAYDPNIGVVTSRSSDNPWADQKYIDQLRTKFGPEYASQELDALFIAFEGYVYDFDKSKHLKWPQISQEWEKVVCGVDPGFADPYAVLYLGRLNNVWHVIDEIYQTKKTTQELLPILQEKDKKYKPSVYWCDARRPTDIQDLRAGHLNARAALNIHAEDDRRTVMPGIRKVQSLLDEGRLFVSPRCEWTIDEFQSYAFPDKESKNRGENPLSWKDHLMDSLRYAMVSEEGINHDLGYARYWNGQEMKPRRQPRRMLRLPTVQESIDAQEREMERKEKQLERAR